MSFTLGFFAASILWNSLALFYYRKICSQEEEEDSDSNDGSDGSIFSDIDAGTTNSLMRWPWDKIRKTIRKSICNSVLSPFLNLEFLEDSDSSVKVNDKRGPCIGEIFGLDVGGTLTKLVYFEEQAHEYKRVETHEQGLHRRDRYNTAASAREVLQARRESNKLHDMDSDEDLKGLIGVRQESVPDRLDEYGNTTYQTNKNETEHENNGHQNENPTTGMRRSTSLSTISKPTEEKKEALDNFYSFARRLDTYETAVKDKHLAYYSKYLNGTFHFIRFETRRMGNAMNLMRYNNFHLHIKEIGATGGGAHKFAEMWDTVLGITMVKQKEMDSLVAGMQFVLSDIDGECYTFKPCDWVPDNNVAEDEIMNDSMLKSPNDSGVSVASDRRRSLPSFTFSEGDDAEDSNLETPSRRLYQPRLDHWWASKKVQREPVVSDPYPYLLVVSRSKY